MLECTNAKQQNVYNNIVNEQLPEYRNKHCVFHTGLNPGAYILKEWEGLLIEEVWSMRGCAALHHQVAPVLHCALRKWREVRIWEFWQGVTWTTSCTCKSQEARRRLHPWPSLRRRLPCWPAAVSPPHTQRFHLWMVPCTPLSAGATPRGNTQR